MSNTVEWSYSKKFRSNSLQDIGVKTLVDMSVDNVHGKFGELLQGTELSPSGEVYKYIFEAGSEGFMKNMTTIVQGE